MKAPIVNTVKWFGIMVFAAIAYLLLLFPALATWFVLLFIKDSREMYNTPAKYFEGAAKAIDLAGNVTHADLLNITLARHGANKFGTPGEYISSVLGKNKRDAAQTGLGKAVADGLDSIDPNHVENSIQNSNP